MLYIQDEIGPITTSIKWTSLILADAGCFERNNSVFFKRRVGQVTPHRHINLVVRIVSNNDRNDFFGAPIFDVNSSLVAHFDDQSDHVDR